MRCRPRFYVPVERPPSNYRSVIYCYLPVEDMSNTYLCCSYASAGTRTSTIRERVTGFGSSSPSSASSSR